MYQWSALIRAVESRMVVVPAEQQDERILNALLRLEMLLHCKWNRVTCGEEMSFESLMDGMMMDGDGQFY